MPLTAPATPAEGGLLSNSAPLLVLAAVIVIALSNRGVNAWVRGICARIRTHLYGPVETYLPPTAESSAEGQADSAAPPAAAADYSIYSIYTREGQQTGRPPADPISE